MNGRRIKGLVGSLAAHAALLAWVVGRPAPEPERRHAPPWVVVEVVEPVPILPGVLSTQAEIPGDPGRSPALVSTPEPERDEPPPPPPPPPRASPPEPSPPVTSSPPSEPAPELETSLGDAEASRPASGEPAEGTGEGTATPRSDEGREGGIASSQPGEGSSQVAGGLVGDGELDHSAYGAEIVRLVLHELDEDPVPGIPQGHAIEIELRVLPDGRLSSRGLGRFDFARVLRSTLGPVRTRWVLRRVERASKHFPPHPDGFSRRVYEIDFTVQFTDHGAG